MDRDSVVVPMVIHMDQDSVEVQVLERNLMGHAVDRLGVKVHILTIPMEKIVEGKNLRNGL